ncbi:hypothetical protein ACIQGZ_29380 [Streptomyces sp. NPDC092296]|uniref:hypothetical protein n=1 Tax=Streptomyces sp. NPDC092296 TaxID=3366012 RepID=UPI00382A59B7
MYAIRVRLERHDGPPQAVPVATTLRAGLEHTVRFPTRLGHARIRQDAGAVDAVLFVQAHTLLEAEGELKHACGVLTGDGAPLSGWAVRRCEADPWIALGLHEE